MDFAQVEYNQDYKNLVLKGTEDLSTSKGEKKEFTADFVAKSFMVGYQSAKKEFTKNIKESIDKLIIKHVDDIKNFTLEKKDEVISEVLDKMFEIFDNHKSCFPREVYVKLDSYIQITFILKFKLKDYISDEKRVVLRLIEELFESYSENSGYEFEVISIPFRNE